MRLSIVSRVVQRPFSEIVVCFVQMGHEWKPPLAKEDSRWDSAQKHGLVRHLIETALLSDVDRLTTVADVIGDWDDDGVTGQDMRFRPVVDKSSIQFHAQAAP
jgi:hypothetical protein